MFVKSNDKIVNLHGCTSIVAKEGRITVYYGDKSEMLGTYPANEATVKLNTILKALEDGDATVTI